MNDTLDLTRSIEELKRVDHQYFVTLKYTRTADVILNTIKRMISAIEFGADDVLAYKLAKNKIKEVPPTNKERVEMLQKFGLLVKDVEFYNFLKKLERAEYKGENEYRKGVAMVTSFAEVDILVLGEYFEHTQALIEKLMKIK
ncbi:hypothetical protein CL622_08100 [archaeon]|nr:hypothetical protein [archaeon]|tara:strand:+ start:2564 stop:2992 length:429 start_codon:yes stop_codon:yes gene_type:complete